MIFQGQLSIWKTGMKDQLYVLDSTAANAHRLQRPASIGCDLDILSILDRLLRQSNEYAKKYRMLSVIEREGQSKAALGKRPARLVSMALH